jgi:hypothetical protein
MPKMSMNCLSQQLSVCVSRSCVLHNLSLKSYHAVVDSELCLRDEHLHVGTCAWLLEAVTDTTGGPAAIPHDRQTGFHPTGKWLCELSEQSLMAQRKHSIHKEPFHHQKLGAWSALSGH